MAAVVLFSYFFNIQPMMQSYYLARAADSSLHIDQSMKWYEKAFLYHTFGDNEAHSRMALTVAQSVQSLKEETLPDNLAEYLDVAIAALKENIENTDERHLLYRLQLSDLYNLKLARTGLESSEIEDIIKKSIQVSPGRMEFEFALAQTEFLKGHFREAVPLLQEASQKNPTHPMPYWKISQNYYFWSKLEKDPEKSNDELLQLKACI